MSTAAKVLVIEGRRQDREALARLVFHQRLPWDLKWAGTLAEARASLAQHAADVVVAAYPLPDGSLAELEEELRGISLVLVLETIQEQVAVRQLIPTADDYLVKDAGQQHLEAVPSAVETAMRRKALRETARQMAWELQATFENTASGIIHADDQDRMVAVNDRFCEMLRYRREELLGKSVLELTHPEDRGKSKELNSRMHSGHLSMLNYEKRYLKKGGTPLWVHLAVSPIRDEEGRYLYSMGTVVDISARKAAEAQVRLQASAMEATSTAISLSTADAHGRIIWVNEAFTRLTGYSAQEIVGCTHCVLSSGIQDEPYYRELWNTITRGDPWRGELVNRRKDGTLYHEDMSITPLRDECGKITHYVAFKEDITQRKQAEASLAAAKHEAEEATQAAEAANRAKDHFLAMLSHELRTPLTPVLTTATLLEQDSQLPAQYREDMAVIRRNVEVAVRLMDDLLDVTRIARGKIELKMQAVSLYDVVHRAIEVCLRDIEAKGLHLDVDTCPEGPCTVYADPERLQQVFWNLIRNAVKFTAPGGCIGIRNRRAEDQVIVEVHDSGEGIAPEVLPHVFNPFEQGGKGVTRQFGGLGLGLTITKGLVEKHGGRIEAFSAGKGKGATFRVTLPILLAHPGKTGMARAAGLAETAETPLVNNHGVVH